MAVCAEWSRIAEVAARSDRNSGNAGGCEKTITVLVAKAAGGDLILNPEVGPASADVTAFETMWESMPSPSLRLAVSPSSLGLVQHQPTKYMILT